MKKAPSPFTAGVLAGALVCLVAGAPWPLVGCLILAAAGHARDAFAEPGASAPVVATTGDSSPVVQAGGSIDYRAYPEPMPAKNRRAPNFDIG